MWRPSPRPRVSLCFVAARLALRLGAILVQQLWQVFHFDGDVGQESF